MPDVLVRDVDLDTLGRLKERAASKGRSLQAEVQSILTEAVTRTELRAEAEVARIIRSAFKDRKQTDSAELLREDRNR
jgi:plasmid stability protein